MRAANIKINGKPSKNFNAIEIHPCKVVKEAKGKERDVVEQCEPDEAEFYSVFVHYVSGGLECIADCITQADAIAFKDLLSNFSKHSKL